MRIIPTATEITPRYLETAAADLAKSLGQPQDIVRERLDAEVLALKQSARFKDFIAILAIKHVKEVFEHTPN